MNTTTYHDELRNSNINNNNNINNKSMKKISGFTIALGIGTVSLMGFLSYRRYLVWKKSKENADGDSKKPQEKTKGEENKVPGDLGKTEDVGTEITENEVGKVIPDEINYLASGNWEITEEFKKIMYFMITDWKRKYSKVYKMEDFYREFRDFVVRSDFMFNTEAMTCVPKNFGAFKELIGRLKITRKINILLLENRNRLEYDTCRIALEKIDRPKREFRPFRGSDNIVEITLTINEDDKIYGGGVERKENKVV